MDISHETIHESEDVVDMETVEAGLVSGISGLFKKFAGWLDNFFDKIGDIGEREGKEFKFAVVHKSAKNNDELMEQIKNAGNDPNKLPDECTLIVKVKFVGGDDSSDVISAYMKRKGTEDSDGFRKENITVKYSDPDNKEQCDNEFLGALNNVLVEFEPKFFESNDGFGELYEISASSKLSMTLRKVVADDEIDVQLVSINSAYSVGETAEILDNILDSDEFIESMPELEPVSYSVDVDEDEYDVNPCESCCVDLSDCILKVLKPLYRLYFDSMYLVWNTTGPNYQSIVNLSDMYQYMSKDLIDKLSIEHFMYSGYAPHPLMFRGEMPIEDIDDTPIEILQKDIQGIIDAIDLYYCNFDGSLQDDLIVARDKFDTELNYTLARF